MNTAEFFKFLLPASGWHCLFVLPDKRHYWFENLDTMAEAALELDAQGKTVYHGTASFNDPGPDKWVPNPKKPGKKKRNWDNDKRSAKNVAAISAYRLDIDAGPVDKPYLDAGAAYRELERWLAAAQLPPPLVVASGGGLHAYWALRTPLDGQRWLAGARGLQALTLQHGLVVDSTTTQDLARILRPPGTHNRKSGAFLVHCSPGEHVAYDTEEFLGLLGKGVMQHSDVPGPALHKTTPLPSYLKAGASLAADLAFQPTQEHEPSDPAAIAAGCAQMRDIREEPAAGWYPIIGVLAHCGPAGHDYARKLATSPEWVPVIEEKLQQWSERTTGPTTCARFGALNPPGCAFCPHQGKIVSPIQLGRNLPAAQTAPRPDILALPKVPDPFFWSKSRKLKVKIEPKEEGGEITDVVVAEYPVHISELQRSERGEGISAVFRSWEPMQSGWTEFVAPLKDLAGDRGLATMAHHGVVISKKRWGHFLEFIVLSVNEFRGSQRYGTRYEQFGWKEFDDGLGFVAGETLYRDGTPATAIHGSKEVERRGKMMRPQGTAAQWSAAVNRLFDQPGMEAHAFIVLCGFAAPLYKFTGEVGGTIVHAQSSATGQAKSVALEANASIWGDLDAIQTIQSDTVVAKFMSFGVLCNLPIVYDEFRHPDVAVLKDIVLQYTLGRDKQRGSAEGGLRGDALPWQNIMCTASNLSLVDAVRSDGGEVAHAARIVEIPMTLPAAARRPDATEMKAQFRANRGTAGPAFIAAVLARQEWVQRAVPAVMRALEQTLGSGPEMRFVIRLFAPVYVAGQICREAGILTFDMSRIMAWAVNLARGNQARIDDDRSGELGSIVGALINDMTPATLVMAGPVRPGPRDLTYTPVKQPNIALKARYEVEGRLWECDVRAIRDWMQKNHQPFSDIERQLLAAGVLRRSGAQKTLGRGSALPGSQVRVWEIDGTHELVAERVEGLSSENVVPLARRG